MSVLNAEIVENMTQNPIEIEVPREVVDKLPAHLRKFAPIRFGASDERGVDDDTLASMSKAAKRTLYAPRLNVPSEIWTWASEQPHVMAMIEAGDLDDRGRTFDDRFAPAGA